MTMTPIGSRHRTRRAFAKQPLWRSHWLPPSSFPSTDHGQTDVGHIQLQAGIHARRLIDFHRWQTDQLVLRQLSNPREDRRVSCGQRDERPGMRRHADAHESANAGRLDMNDSKLTRSATE